MGTSGNPAQPIIRIKKISTTVPLKVPRTKHSTVTLAADEHGFLKELAGKLNLNISDFRSLTNRKGEPNPHPWAGKPYETASLPEIVELAKNPPVCPKEQAYWMMASRYHEADARTFAVQEAKGSYKVFLVDIDHGNLTLEQVKAAVCAVLPNTYALINSTSSATANNKKWHVTIWLENSCAYEVYNPFQQALFKLLEAQGVKCDYPHAFRRPHEDL